jgi:hypothetical protein
MSEDLRLAGGRKGRRGRKANKCSVALIVFKGLDGSGIITGRRQRSPRRYSVIFHLPE